MCPAGQDKDEKGPGGEETHLVSESCLFHSALHDPAPQKSVTFECSDVCPHDSVYLGKELLCDLAQFAL